MFSPPKADLADLFGFEIALGGEFGHEAGGPSEWGEAVAVLSGVGSAVKAAEGGRSCGVGEGGQADPSLDTGYSLRRVTTALKRFPSLSSTSSIAGYALSARSTPLPSPR